MGWYNTIRATSPVASTYAGLPEDQDDWVCSNWQVYHMRNKTALGKQPANELFLIDMGRIGMFASAWKCKYDCDFLKYLEQNGIPYNSFITNIYCTAENITEATEKLSGTTVNLAKIAIPLVVVGGLLYFFKDEFKK